MPGFTRTTRVSTSGCSPTLRVPMNTSASARSSEPSWAALAASAENSRASFCSVRIFSISARSTSSTEPEPVSLAVSRSAAARFASSARIAIRHFFPAARGTVGTAFAGRSSVKPRAEGAIGEATRACSRAAAATASASFSFTAGCSVHSRPPARLSNENSSTSPFMFAAWVA